MTEVHSPKARNNAVDALRAILIFSVVLYHYLVFWAPPFMSVDHLHYHHGFPSWLAIGRFGVEVFFAISGYVITMTLERSNGPGDFLFRRFSRLFPAYFVCSLLTFIFLKLSNSELYPITLLDWLASLTAHADFLHRVMVDGSYWSLGVEVRFYLWVALFFFLLQSRFWIGIVFLGTLAIIQQIFSLHFTNYWMIGSYISFFLVGMSFRYFEYGNKVAGIWTLAVGLTLYALRTQDFSSPVENEFLSVNIYIIGLALLLLVMTNTKIFDRMNLGFLPYLGRLSYCFYLLHQAIGVTIIGRINTMTNLPDIAAPIIAGAITLLLAAAVHHGVEEPARRFLTAAASGRKKLAPAS